MPAAAQSHVHHTSCPVRCVVEARAHICLPLRVHGVHPERLPLLDLRVAASFKRLILCLEMSRASHVLLLLQLVLLHVLLFAAVPTTA